jgi:hypothetical protein
VSARLLDIGDYVYDSRLVQHGERYASFYGHRCNPAVYVNPTADGYRAAQNRSESRDGLLISLEPTVTATGATAAEALAKLLGPVQR